MGAGVALRVAEPLLSTEPRDALNVILPALLEMWVE
jgi:hypothetical protein